MIKEIGETAGLIWHFLDTQSEPVNLSTLKKNVNASSNLILMALGWLAREDKVTIELSEDTYSYRISLKR